MKKGFYIALFTFLGILLQLIIHALLEKWYIGLLISDFNTYGIGLSWSVWFFIHHIVAIFLFIGGALFGFWQGKYWWRVIYEEKRK